MKDRIELIKMILNEKISKAEACRRMHIKITTGALIYRNFRYENRIMQKNGSKAYFHNLVIPKQKIPKKNNRD